MKKRKWTSQEEAVVIEEISLHPNNLSKAFTLASSRINRSKAAIRQCWYSKLSKERNLPVFGLIAENRYVLNRKNGDFIKTKTSIFSKIKKWLHI